MQHMLKPITPVSPRPYYGVVEAARLLGVNRVTLWRWIAAGRLPVYRAGPRTVRIRRQDLERLLVRAGRSDNGASAEADREHFVQFYQSDAFLADAVADFVGGGLRTGAAGIVIATAEHRAAIEERLGASGLDVAAQRSDGSLVVLDAAETLARFMVGAEPDEGRFMAAIGEVVARAAEGGRPVRAFGEMVALLALEGNVGAAVRLEQLWNRLQKETHSFSLFCAYPIDRLGSEAFAALMDDVCAAHSRVVPAESYEAADGDDRGRLVAELQLKAARLEAEIEQRLRAERALRDFVESAAIAMHWVAPDGTILWANRAELEMLGYTAEEYVGRHVKEFYVDPEMVDDILARLRDGETLQEHAAQLRCKDGSVRDVLIDSSVLWEEERFVHTRCFTRDVTELRRLEADRKRLLETERAARLAAEAQAAVHVGLNASLRDVAVERDRALEAERAARATAERAAERVRHLQEITRQLSQSLEAGEVLASIARSAAALLDAPVGAVFLLDQAEPHGDFALAAAHGIDAARAPELRLPRRASLAGRAVDQRETLVVDDVRETAGTALPALLTGETAGSEIAAPIAVGDKRLGVVKAFSPTVRRFDPEDAELLTALAAAAAVALTNAELYRGAQEAIRARDEFLASAAHDLKTPLTAIKGTAQLLRRLAASPNGVDVARLTEGLTGVDTAATRLARQVDQLLDITRLRAGEPLLLRRQPTKLADVVGVAVEEHRRATDRHRIVVEEHGGELVGDWDRGRIERVLDNLIGNAVKYSPAGGDVVVSLARWRAGAGEWAEVAVRDQGIGIPEADIGSVFDRFRRGSNVPEPIGGSGIGLASVRQIVEAHGGEVAVESREGAGSTFRVRLPLAAA
jgi:PAS domain S-box-containing protein/excisionase family DNA binding protein